MLAILDPVLAPLVGSWRLLSARATFSDTGECVEPFGPQPNGHMVLSPGGRITFLITRPDRRPPADDAERAALYDSMIACSGRVRLDAPGRFVTTVDISLIPSEVGREKSRCFTVDGDRLTIRSDKQVTRRGVGRETEAELTWVRELPTGAADFALLSGSWSLLSMGFTFTDTQERIEPRGPDPSGCLVLAPSGRIMVLFTRSHRQPPANDAERANLFNDVMAYTGLIRLDGTGCFITSVDGAANPSWTGEQTRLFAIDQDRLTIRTNPQAVPLFPGRLVVSDILFVREHSIA